MTTTRTLPIEAFRQRASVSYQQMEGEGENFAVSLVALSGEPLVDYWLGQRVQDISGMEVEGDKVMVDYCHDDREVMGFIDTFEAGNNLVLKGQLTPFQEGDRANEVIHKLKAGIPYEASIEFTPSQPGDLQIEELSAGESAQVNGREVHGPATIFRKWHLRRVAICPSGWDRQTSVEAQQDKNQTVEVQIMATPKTKDPAEPVVKLDEPLAVVPIPKPVVQTEDVRQEFLSFCQQFGDEKGAHYFKLGLNMVAAQAQYADDLKAENAALKTENEELKTQQAPEPVAGNDPAGADPQADQVDEDIPESLRVGWMKYCKGDTEKYETLKQSWIANDKKKKAKAQYA